jgi:hypothetical protein
MSMQDPEADAAAKIIKSAIEAGVAVRCPLHPTELIALGDGEVFPAPMPVEVRGRVIELLTTLPTSCPRCADESE